MALPSQDEFIENRLMLHSECIICNNEYGPEHLPTSFSGSMSCGHVFGSSCIRTWLESDQPASNKCPICRVALYQGEEEEPEENEQENNEEDEEEEGEVGIPPWEEVDGPTFLGLIQGSYRLNSLHHSNYHLLEDVNNQDVAESFILALWDEIGGLNDWKDLYDEDIEIAIYRATEQMDRSRIILKVDLLDLIDVGKEMAGEHYSLQNHPSYDIGRPDILAYWVERVGDVMGWQQFS